MDILAVIAATPLGVLVPYITFAISIATALLLLMPAPGATSSPVYATIYNLVHLVANLKSAPGASTVAVKPPPTAAVVLLLGLAGLGLVACTPAQQAQSLQVMQVICQGDGVVQPVAVAFAPMLGAGTAAAVSVDQALVHPAVTGACAALNKTPLSVAPMPDAAAPVIKPAT